MQHLHRVRFGRAAPYQHQMARACLCQPLGNCQSQPAQSAGDEVSRIRADGERRFIRHDHQLAGVLARRHKAEGIRHLRSREHAHREGLQAAIRKALHDFLEQPRDQVIILARFQQQVDHSVHGVGPDLRELLRAPDAALADFNEAAVICQDGDGFGDEFVRQRVEHDVYALAAGDCHDFVREFQGARVHHVLHAQGFQHGAFGRRSGGGKDFRTDLPGKLHRRQPYSARRRVDQNLIAGFHLCQMLQGIGGSEEGGRDGRRLREGQMGRFLDHIAGRSDGIGGKAVQGHRDHRVAYAHIVDTLAQRRDDARALAAQVAAAGIHAQRVEHVAEADAGRQDLELHLTRAGGLALGFLIDEVVQVATLANRQA